MDFLNGAFDFFFAEFSDFFLFEALDSAHSFEELILKLCLNLFRGAWLLFKSFLVFFLFQNHFFILVNLLHHRILLQFPLYLLFNDHGAHTLPIYRWNRFFRTGKRWQSMGLHLINVISFRGEVGCPCRNFMFVKLSRFLNCCISPLFSGDKSVSLVIEFGWLLVAFGPLLLSGFLFIEHFVFNIYLN